MRKLLLYVLLCLIILPINVRAQDKEFTLFDSNILVNSDRTLEITENYSIYFVEDITMLTRKINTKVTQINPNGKKRVIVSKISDISSDSNIIRETNKSIEEINISVNGKRDEIQSYLLNYKLNLGKDLSKNTDELYYDIVSNLDASISNLTFQIQLPFYFDEENIAFSINNSYNLTNDDITYIVENNKIIGALNRLLEANDTFSVYIELPNGYFSGETDNFNYAYLLLLLIPLIGVIFVLILWFKYGKKNKLKIKQLTEFSTKYDSTEIGYLFKGKSDEKDITSIIIFLATKGYLKIVENDDGYKLGKENSFKFVKLKNYEKNNAVQKIIFDNLFKEKDIIELQDIEYNFAKYFKEAKSTIDTKDNDKKLFFQDLNIKKIIVLMFIVLSIVIVNFNSIYLFTNTYWLVPIISLLFIFSLYIIFLSNAHRLGRTIIGGLILIGCLFVGISPIYLQFRLLIIYIIGILLIIMMCVLYTKLSNRTKFGNEVLGEVYSLKYYLEKITINELDKLVKQNPDFYFDMIPYAYVLNSLDIWIKKGKGLITSPPDWYVPSSEFDILKFEKFIKNVIYTTTLVMMKQTYSEYGKVEYTNQKVKTNLND